MHLSLINNSEKLFIPEAGWKIKYTNILRKKTKWRIKSKEAFVYFWEENVWKTTIKKLTEKGLTTNKNFWKFIKQFLTNKGFVGNKDITLIHKNKVITDEKQLTKLFTSHYINIVEKSIGTKPKTFGINFERTSVHSIRDTTNCYRNHPSFIKIKQVVNVSNVSDSERIPSKRLMKLKWKTFWEI